MKYKCIIVDDEPLASQVLKNHISKFDNLELIGSCKDSFEAINFLNNNKVDLMLLDINMPEMKGTDLLKSLSNPPKVILTTAYREYALEGYELNVVDYLLKPIAFDRFLLAINKFIETQTTQHTDITIHQNNNSENHFIYVREKNIVHKIPLKNIEYIESNGDYITIHTTEKRTTIRSTIASIETMLKNTNFVRIHRSFIINIEHIFSFSSHSIFMREKELPIGPVYKNEVFKALDYDKFKDMK